MAGDCKALKWRRLKRHNDDIVNKHGNMPNR